MRVACNVRKYCLFGGFGSFTHFLLCIMCVTGRTCPRFWYATPPPVPLPALWAKLVAKGQQLLAIDMVAPKAPENFFSSFHLPIWSTLHPNIVLEPNLDSNAHAMHVYIPLATICTFLAGGALLWPTVLHVRF